LHDVRAGIWFLFNVVPARIGTGRYQPCANKTEQKMLVENRPDAAVGTLSVRGLRSPPDRKRGHQWRGNGASFDID